MIAGEKDKASVEGAKNLLYNHPERLQMKVITSGVGHIYGVLAIPITDKLSTKVKIRKNTKYFFIVNLLKNRF